MNERITDCADLITERHEFKKEKLCYQLSLDRRLDSNLVDNLHARSGQQFTKEILYDER